MSLISGCGMLIRGRCQYFCATVSELTLGKLPTKKISNSNVMPTLRAFR